MNYARRSARNWYTAMGILFIPGFVLDFLLNSEITNEKVSLGMIVFGSFLIVIGFKKRIPKK